METEIMSKQAKPLSIAFGTFLVAGLGATGIANAATAEEDNDLFSMEELTSGYLMAGAHETPDEGDDDEEGGDGEGSCGGDKEGEGKCGEGKCGSS
jgi:uncharacterized low-complexity protein